MDAMTNAELRKHAEELGIKVDARWNKSRLIAEIEKAKSPGQVDTPKLRIKNVSGSRWSVLERDLKPGDIYAPDDADKANDRMMRKVARGVSMGKLEWVA